MDIINLIKEKEYVYWTEYVTEVNKSYKSGLISISDKAERMYIYWQAYKQLLLEIDETPLPHDEYILEEAEYRYDLL